MSGIYHVVRLLSVAWAAMSLLWAQESNWGHVAFAATLFTISHFIAENMRRCQ